MKNKLLYFSSDFYSIVSRIEIAVIDPVFGVGNRR